MCVPNDAYQSVHLYRKSRTVEGLINFNLPTIPSAVMSPLQMQVKFILKNVYVYIRQINQFLEEWHIDCPCFFCFI